MDKMKRMRPKLAKNLGISPPYTAEEHEGFQKFLDGVFVVYDDHENILHHVGLDEDVDRSFNGDLVQFSLPKKGSRRKGKIDIAYTDQDVEAMNTFREGYFLIWDPNSRTLYASGETKIGFNGPNLSFVIPKRRGRK